MKINLNTNYVSSIRINKKIKHNNFSNTNSNSEQIYLNQESNILFTKNNGRKAALALASLLLLSSCAAPKTAQNTTSQEETAIIQQEKDLNELTYDSNEPYYQSERYKQEIEDYKNNTLIPLLSSLDDKTTEGIKAEIERCQLRIDEIDPYADDYLRSNKATLLLVYEIMHMKRDIEECRLNFNYMEWNYTHGHQMLIDTPEYRALEQKYKEYDILLGRALKTSDEFKKDYGEAYFERNRLRNRVADLECLLAHMRGGTITKDDVIELADIVQKSSSKEPSDEETELRAKIEDNNKRIAYIWPYITNYAQKQVEYFVDMMDAFRYKTQEKMSLDKLEELMSGYIFPFFIPGSYKYQYDIHKEIFDEQSALYEEAKAKLVELEQEGLELYTEYFALEKESQRLEDELFHLQYD